MEKPNLNYIEEISNGNEVFKQKFFSLLKEELPKEIANYNNNFKAKNYSAAAADVHKLKHKIAILGIPKSQNIASQFEKNLLNNNESLYLDFDIIIKNIATFVDKL